MKQTMSVVFLFLICCCSFAATCWGWQETLTIEEDYQTHVFRGEFREEVPGGVYEGELLFSYEVQSPGINKHERYYFSGRTGGDSFEIRHTWAVFGSFRAGRPEQESLKVTYKPGGEYPLAMTRLTFPGCTNKETALLKMLSLQDKAISYRIILPACLTEALKKEEEKRKQH